MTVSNLDRSLREFLDVVATKQPAPGGGAVAAVALSLAASLVAMAARYSAALLDNGERLVEEAETLRVRAAGLADADAEAYGAVIAAYARARDDDSSARDEVRTALGRAALVPLEIAEIGAETARLAAVLAIAGKLDVRGDAVTGVLLAEAATHSAAHLVAINVEAGGGDIELARRATDSVTTARHAAESVK